MISFPTAKDGPSGDSGRGIELHTRLRQRFYPQDQEGLQGSPEVCVARRRHHVCYQAFRRYGRFVCFE